MIQYPASEFVSNPPRDAGAPRRRKTCSRRGHFVSSFTLASNPESEPSSRQDRGNRADRGEITAFLNSLETDEGTTAEDLIPLVYQELRRLAISRMANEAPGHTLQATA